MVCGSTPLIGRAPVAWNAIVKVSREKALACSRGAPHLRSGASGRPVTNDGMRKRLVAVRKAPRRSLSLDLPESKRKPIREAYGFQDRVEENRRERKGQSREKQKRSVPSGNQLRLAQRLGKGRDASAAGCGARSPNISSKTSNGETVQKRKVHQGRKMMKRVWGPVLPPYPLDRGTLGNRRSPGGVGRGTAWPPISWPRIVSRGGIERNPSEIE